MPTRTDAETLVAMGTDAAKWAAEFVHLRKTRDMDEGAMISWFANAIEAGRSAGMKATCPHKDTSSYGDDPAPLVLCNTCGAVL
jgi:hypothetical protein